MTLGQTISNNNQVSVTILQGSCDESVLLTKIPQQRKLCWNGAFDWRLVKPKSSYHMENGTNMSYKMKVVVHWQVPLVFNILNFVSPPISDGIIPAVILDRVKASIEHQDKMMNKTATIRHCIVSKRLCVPNIIISPISDGMLPLRSFNSRPISSDSKSKVLYVSCMLNLSMACTLSYSPRFVKRPSSVGRLPVILLSYRIKVLNPAPKFPISVGIEPERPFSWRLRASA